MRLYLCLFLIAATGLVALTACNSLEQSRKNVTSAPAGAPAAQPVGPAPVFADGVRRVTVPELHGLLAKGEAIVIDVRTQDAYNLAHIQGSRFIPEAEVATKSDQLPKNKLIVTYCS